MTHKPIQLQDIGLSYPHKICFQEFNNQIYFGNKIAIIGCNGAGKSTLLQMLHGSYSPTEGEIKLPDDVTPGYLPQIIDDFPELSGGQRLNQLLTKVLTLNPNFLLLDEPTNHLDDCNRRSLIRMLKNYSGTLVIASHDIALINATTDILWHIDAKHITVFSGCYQDYQQLLTHKKLSIEQDLLYLAKQKKKLHLDLMKEQERNKQLRKRGQKHIEQRKWPTIRSHTKLANSITTGEKRLNQIQEKKQECVEKLSGIYQPKIICPKFKLKSSDHHKIVISIQNASVAYANGSMILQDIHFHMTSKARIALCGNNGSGKSTLVKAILNDAMLKKTGDWIMPFRTDIGYLDQHYSNLVLDKTALELTTNVMPKASHAEIRTHLNDFLFFTNEEVQTLVKNLSGGEKARLSLALIAANPPKLLILDELTNNLDFETRTHVIQVLCEFPGAMIIISHDQDFLEAINIDTMYQVTQGKVMLLNANFY